MPATASGISEVAALGAPVLCLDTCILLDIMRDPTRDTVQAHEMSAALNLLRAMETGTDLVGLVADQVASEFAENVGRVEEEAIAALKKLRRSRARIGEIVAVFGGGETTELKHLDGHVARAREIVNRWLSVAIPTPQGENIPLLAYKRVMEPRTPARKGKESMKDCVIIETYLDFVSRLRAAGLGAKIVFVSSNVRDYAGETARMPKPDLAQDFARVGMDDAPNLAAAKHLLGL